MSRVDDEREAARLAAKQMEARRAEEQRKTSKAKENNAFSRMVAEQKKSAQNAQAQQTEAQSAAKSAIAMLLEQAEGPQSGAAMQKQHATTSQEAATFKGRLGARETEGRVHEETRSASHQGDEVKQRSDSGSASQASARGAESGSASRRAEARSADAKRGAESLSERADASDAASSSGRAGAMGEKGDLKADADKGGGQQGGGKDKDKGGGPAMAAGFRFNPALMAPMAVAKPKEASGSERLRKVANELAQKIVENVRVGTNASGRSEFQIDLRSNVLSGLSVKVSSHQGKISAVFSGSNKDVMKLIEEHSEALKKALADRGLSLEDLSFEARP